MALSMLGGCTHRSLAVPEPALRSAATTIGHETTHGRHLERLPDLAGLARRTDVIRPASFAGFSPAYHLTGPSARPWKVAVWGDAPRVGASFVLPCRGEATISAWLAVGSRASSGVGEIVLSLGPRLFRAPVPASPGALVRLEIPVTHDLCREGRLEARVVGVRVPEDTLLVVPELLTPRRASHPDVILISIDTLRADFWERAPRPPLSTISIDAPSVSTTPTPAIPQHHPRIR